MLPLFVYTCPPQAFSKLAERAGPGGVQQLYALLPRQTASGAKQPSGDLQVRPALPALVQRPALTLAQRRTVKWVLLGDR